MTFSSMQRNEGEIMATEFLKPNERLATITDAIICRYNRDCRELCLRLDIEGGGTLCDRIVLDLGNCEERLDELAYAADVDLWRKSCRQVVGRRVIAKLGKHGDVKRYLLPVIHKFEAAQNAAEKGSLTAQDSLGVEQGLGPAPCEPGRLDSTQG